jgi:hypothetical protein
MHLLAGSVAETCLGCHSGDSADFQERHLGLPAATLDCASCHDPHASQGEGLLLPLAHEPFASGDCTACHPPPADVEGGES